MNQQLCPRWFNRNVSDCSLAECLVAGACDFADFDKFTNIAFGKAMESELQSHRPRILDADGGVQMCEQCNDEDGKAVIIGDGSLSVSRVWAHNAFNSGICRLVYICDVCLSSIRTAENAANAWFDAHSYGIDEKCPTCRAQMEVF